ncbi:8836_t:CDS:1 [Funneliformis mosseae]|uniref:8836_t:CDS:1 n=1 Tax=Funneliformis mosseae TaxID=27381 RepID=A0A9N8ZSI2_FUNMO|nr:8836_t:CDS:1 [Funneliformis mosseae]
MGHSNFSIKRFSNKLKFPKLSKLTKSKPVLIPDILDEIFRCLSDDRTSLHSCILVSRLWCRLAIPILWSNPFMKPNYYGYFAVRTYICCLDESEKSLLRQQQIRIPTHPSPPLFDYPSFLLTFIYSNFAIGLEDFVTGNEIDFLHMNGKRMIISSVIVNMIFSRSRGIREFDYYRTHLSRQIILTLDHSLSLLGGKREERVGSSHSLINNSLDKIQSFRFNGSCIMDEVYSITWPNFLNTISSSATNIKHLSFRLNNTEFSVQSIYNSIANLVGSQRALKSFEINEIWIPRHDKVIFNSLCKQGDSLSHIRLFGRVRLSCLMEVLVICNNLTTLEVEEFHKNDHVPILKYRNANISINKLCYLQNQPESSTVNTHNDYGISFLLQMISNNLKTFTCKYFCSEYFINLKKYSVNLTHLRIIIKSQTISRFSKVLSLMNSLKQLYVESPKEEYCLFTEAMIHQLAHSLPYSLHHLSLNLSFTMGLLKTFLSACSIHLISFELFVIYEPHRKYSLFIMEYYDRVGSLQFIKLSRYLLEKYHFSLHYKKKLSYKVIESLPIWIQDQF